MKLRVFAVKSINSLLPIGKLFFWQPCNTTLSFLNSNPCHFTFADWLLNSSPNSCASLWTQWQALQCWSTALVLSVAPSGAAPSSVLSSLGWVPWQWPPHLSNSRKPKSTSSTKIMLIGVKGCKTWTGIVVFAGGTKLCFSLKLGKSIKIAGKQKLCSYSCLQF